MIMDTSYVSCLGVYIVYLYIIKYNTYIIFPTEINSMDICPLVANDRAQYYILSIISQCRGKNHFIVTIRTYSRVGNNIIY